jgi:hypothetical protein
MKITWKAWVGLPLLMLALMLALNYGDSSAGIQEGPDSFPLSFRNAVPQLTERGYYPLGGITYILQNTRANPDSTETHTGGMPSIKTLQDFANGEIHRLVFKMDPTEINHAMIDGVLRANGVTALPCDHAACEMELAKYCGLDIYGPDDVVEGSSEIQLFGQYNGGSCSIICESGDMVVSYCHTGNLASRPR